MKRYFYVKKSLSAGFVYAIVMFACAASAFADSLQYVPIHNISERELSLFMSRMYQRLTYEHQLDIGVVILKGHPVEVRRAALELRQLGEERRKFKIREAKTQRATLQNRLVTDILDQKIKVIRLRYSQVNTVERQFQNRRVVVPGIDQALSRLLGLTITEEGTNATGQTPASRRAETYLADAAARKNDETALILGLSEAAKPVVSVDPRSNAVIVRGSDRQIEAIAAIIEQLDQPALMIELDVMILRAEKGVLEELGVAYRANLTSGDDNRAGKQDRSEAFAVDTGVSSNAARTTSNSVDAASLLPAFANGLGGVGLSFLVKAGDAFLQTQIRALQAEEKARTLASPKVITLNHIAARISDEQSEFITIAQGDQLGVTEILAGLTLDVTPSILDNERDTSGQAQQIRLSIRAANAALTEPLSTANNIGRQNQEVQTEVVVPEATTLVLGGLFADNRTVGESGLPLVKDIPVLGQLFRSNNENFRQTELIFFITPRVVDPAKGVTDATAQQLSAQAKLGVQAGRLELHQVQKDMAQNQSLFFPRLPRFLEEDE